MDKAEILNMLDKFGNRLDKLESYMGKEIKRLERKRKQLEKENRVLKIATCLRIIISLGKLKERQEDYSINQLFTFWQLYFFLYAHKLKKQYMNL